MKIGVTSQNFKTITGHAGKTRRFLVFSASEEGQWVEVDRLNLTKDMSIHEFKGRAHPVDDFDVLITAGCGQGFINKMAGRGVNVVATSETDPAKAVNDFAAGVTLAPAEPHTH